MNGREVLLLCPAGAEPIVRRAAHHDLQDFDARRVSSGFVLGSTSASDRLLRAAPYATNVFETIAQTRRSELAREVAQLLRQVEAHRAGNSRLRGTFRIRIFNDGIFAALSTAGPVPRLVNALERQFGGRYDSCGGGTEFWIIRRRDEPKVYLGHKLSSANPRVPKGTLRPELAAALVRSIDLQGAHVLDPFAGSGVIGIAALNAGASRVWVNDLAPDSLQLVERLPAAVRRAVTTGHLDIRAIQPVSEPVTAIVTDPPWGVFRTAGRSADDLHLELLDLSNRMLGPGGPLVILTGISDGVVERIRADNRFSFEPPAPVLVNGKKAVVLIGARR